METGDPVLNIFHAAAIYVFSRHFFKAERAGRDTQAIGSVDPHRESAGGTYYTEVSVRQQPVQHTNNTLPFRYDHNIMLGC